MPIPQKEFGFASDTFNLFQESAEDGERVAKETDQLLKERQAAAKAQAPLFRG